MARMLRNSATDSVMLFGSAARGELNAESDIDILVIRAGSALGPVAIWAELPTSSSPLIRTPSWLRTVAAGGQLFALHLQREGRVLRDPTGVLAMFRRTPISVPFDQHIRSVRQSSSVLHASDLDTATGSAMSVARYLLRTAVFLRCARNGTPTFSHYQAAMMLREPEVTVLLSRDVSVEAFPRMRQRLKDLVGEPDRVGWSLRELASVPTCRHLALQLLRDDVIVDYDPERVVQASYLAA
jgi:Nucleotidyltransferase domain